MAQSTPGSPFADLLKQTLELSKQVQESQDAAADAEPVVVERAEGQIQVTAKTNTEIAIYLNPIAFRMGSEILAQELAAAVNESLTTLKDRQLSVGNLDLEAVNQQVEEISSQATAQLTNFMDGLMRAHTAAGEAEQSRKE
ncbi:hypothetical protein [Glycomyces terrestris]|uniref:YbaB/EbfC family DNA-binding protein n=1 Tax=Glycomyces terrestris TaxID=2493553 RepID=A0A426V4K9_9ACTN|nr:hypothetical protein [Glycomyces terrestris]RRS01758.1 hypothetical protein EIW28_03090 [Glycomyces terrestris]